MALMGVIKQKDSYLTFMNVRGLYEGSVYSKDTANIEVFKNMVILCSGTEEDRSIIRVLKDYLKDEPFTLNRKYILEEFVPSCMKASEDYKTMTTNDNGTKTMGLTFFLVQGDVAYTVREDYSISKIDAFDVDGDSDLGILYLARTQEEPLSKDEILDYIQKSRKYNYSTGYVTHFCDSKELKEEIVEC